MGCGSFSLGVAGLPQFPPWWFQALPQSGVNSQFHSHLALQGDVSSVTVAVLAFWKDTCEPLRSAWSAGPGRGWGWTLCGDPVH